MLIKEFYLQLLWTISTQQVRSHLLHLYGSVLNNCLSTMVQENSCTDINDISSINQIININDLIENDIEYWLVGGFNPLMLVIFFILNLFVIICQIIIQRTTVWYILMVKAQSCISRILGAQLAAAGSLMAARLGITVFDFVMGLIKFAFM